MPAVAVPEPLRGEVHPQASVGAPDVLEDVDAVGAELPPDVGEGLGQQRRRRRALDTPTSAVRSAAGDET